MNIEEERKAFEADVKTRYPGVCLVRWPASYRNQHIEAAYLSWIAAKEHAEKQYNALLAVTANLLRETINLHGLVCYDRSMCVKDDGWSAVMNEASRLLADKEGEQ